MEKERTLLETTYTDRCEREKREPRLTTKRGKRRE